MGVTSEILELYHTLKLLVIRMKATTLLLLCAVSVMLAQKRNPPGRIPELLTGKGECVASGSPCSRFQRCCFGRCPAPKGRCPFPKVVAANNTCTKGLDQADFRESVPSDAWIERCKNTM